MLSERLEKVERRIETALRRVGRTRSEITLVAVTKKFSADVIREAFTVRLSPDRQDAGKSGERSAIANHSYTALDAARQTVLANFTWERCGRQTVAAYEHALR